MTALNSRAAAFQSAPDFFFGLCEFINLTFCGGQPGNIQGGYIYNWPVSQWAGVVHYKIAPGFPVVGRCLRRQSGLSDDVRPRHLLLAWHPCLDPRQGVMVPVELVWAPRAPLTGTWRFGGWYDSASTIDGGLPGVFSSSRASVVSRTKISAIKAAAWASTS